MNVQYKEKLKEFKKQFFCEAKEFLVCLVFAWIIGILIAKVFFMIAVVPTESMENTIPTGSIVLCSRMSYWGDNSPQRGDVVIFNRNIEDDDVAYTKRVVGLPGDIVEIKDGITYINGKEYPETWLAETPNKEDFGPFCVEKKQYFCMGDNRNNSYDCRYWEEHFVNEEDILAKGYFVVSSELDTIFKRIQ